MKGNLWLIVIALLVIGGLGWLWYDASKPLPGEAVPDLGRQHVTPGTKVDYNSNPPTSGNHYSEWTRKGVYDQTKEDGNLIHSLEHGYIVISYNCTKQFSIFNFQFSKVYAQESEATNSATNSATVSGEAWEAQECKDLAKKLFDIYKKKGEDRLIVVPRPSLDTRIALTAWTRIDKFDNFDEGRITRFIDAHRNHGPEKTME